MEEEACYEAIAEICERRGGRLLVNAGDYEEGRERGPGVCVSENQKCRRV